MVEVEVSDRIRVRGLSEESLFSLRSEFEHRNPKRGEAGEPDFLVTWGEGADGTPSFPRGGKSRIEERLSGVPCRWSDKRAFGRSLAEPLLHHQKLWEAQERLLAAILEHETALVCSPTGSGKSTTALALAAAVRVPTLVVVHNAGLQKQWVDRVVEEMGISREEVGRIGGGEWRVRPITIAIVNTLVASGGRDVEGLHDYFGCVIVDEVHRAAAEMMRTAIDPFRARYRVGMSADPTRKDKLECLVYDLFGEPVAEVSRAETIAAGNVLDVEVLVVPTRFSAPWYVAAMRRPARYPQEKNVASTKLLGQICEDAGRDEIAVACAEGELNRGGGPVVVLSRRVEHCKRLDLLLIGAGAKTGYFLGGKPNAKMFDQTKEGLVSGRLQVGVGTIEALGTGIDLPSVTAGIVATPVASNKQLFGQIRGRVCRVARGKTSARLYYLWDYKVHPKHLANLVAWNSRVRLLTADGWVDAREAIDDLQSLDLESGITEKLREGSLDEMKSRKPVDVGSEAKSPTQERTVEQFDRGDDFNRGQSSADLARDDSALCIALKAKGWGEGVSEVRAWSGAEKLSAAAWALGKLVEAPAHVQNNAEARRYNEEAAPKQARLGLEEDLSALAIRLAMKGVDVKLTQLAAWQPGQRAEAARWCEGMGGRPAFLAGAEMTTAARSRTVPVAETEARSEVVGFSDPIVVTWGEEKYCLSPGSFSSCGVGPYVETTRCRPGETSSEAHARVYAELEKRAEADRDRKLASHRRKLVEAGILKEGR